MAVAIVAGLLAVLMGLQTDLFVLFGAIYAAPFLLILLAGCIYKPPFQRVAAVSIGALLPIIGYHIYYLTSLKGEKTHSTDMVNGLLIMVGLPSAIAFCAWLGATFTKGSSRD
jgi:hypothetical protein